MAHVNIWLAFWAGFASFISPCCLPLYPSFLSYITGISVSSLKSGLNRREIRFSTMKHSLFFILGFSIVFMALGLTVGSLGRIFYNYKDIVRQLAAILIGIMGLVMLGILKPHWMMSERKLQIKWKPAGYLGTVLIGMGFAAGWSPCTGPILSAILALSFTQPGTWFYLIAAYTLGFGVPFFLLGFFVGSTKWIGRYSTAFMKIGGVLMIIVALLLYTNEMTRLTIWFNLHTPNWLKF